MLVMKFDLGSNFTFYIMGTYDSELFPETCPYNVQYTERIGTLKVVV